MDLFSVLLLQNVVIFCPAPAHIFQVLSHSRPQNPIVGHLCGMNFSVPLQPTHVQPCVKTTNLAPVYVKHGLFLAALLQTQIAVCTFSTRTLLLFHFIHIFIFCESPTPSFLSPALKHASVPSCPHPAVKTSPTQHSFASGPAGPRGSPMGPQPSTSVRF